MASNKLRTRITYTSEVVDQMTPQEVRSAYTKLRHIAKQRFDRLAKYGYQDYVMYQRAEKELKGLPKMAGRSDAEVAQLLLDTSRWLRDPRSKAGVAYKMDTEILKTLHKEQYDFVTRENLHEFLDYLNDLKDQKDQKWDYEKVVEAYGQAKRLNVPVNVLKANFQKWMDNMKKIEKIEATEDNSANLIAVQKAWAPEKKGKIKYARKPKYGKK